MKKRFLTGFMILMFSLMPCMEAKAMAVDSDVTQESNVLALGNESTAVIDTNGSLWTWGNNEWGTLGNGTQKKSLVPTKIMSRVKSVYMEEDTAAALKTDGSLWTWGNNVYGNLGNGTDTYSLVPAKVMSNVKSYYHDYSTPAAIKTDGSLWMWGGNYYGELGNGTTKPTNAPIKVMNHVKSVAIGTCGTVAAVKADGSLWMWGRNDYGQFGNGTTENSSVPIKIMDGVKSVKVNQLTTAVIKEDDSLWMWGFNEYGQLGNGTTEDYSTVPTKVMDDVKDIYLNDTFVTAVKKDGSLWLWSNNMMRVLYNGPQKLTKPCKIMDDVKAGFGNHHTVALIKEDNSLWTWGNNGGQLGLGLSEPVYYQPTKVMDDVKVICQNVYSYNHPVAAVIKADGTLWMWGKNEYGQLGNGTTTDSAVPIKIMDNVALPGSLTFDKSVWYKTVPAKGTALEIPVNGNEVVFEAYSIENNNYVKLRDVAFAVNGTEKQFNITWDDQKKAINMITDTSYTAVGTELQLQKNNISYVSKSQNASENTAKIYLNGKTVNMKAYIIDGNTYFKLRDLGNVLGFYVGWDAETGTVTLDTNK